MSYVSTSAVPAEPKLFDVAAVKAVMNSTIDADQYLRVSDQLSGSAGDCVGGGWSNNGVSSSLRS